MLTGLCIFLSVIHSKQIHDCERFYLIADYILFTNLIEGIGAALPSISQALYDLDGVNTFQDL